MDDLGRRLALRKFKKVFLEFFQGFTVSSPGESAPIGLFGDHPLAMPWRCPGNRFSTRHRGPYLRPLNSIRSSVISWVMARWWVVALLALGCSSKPAVLPASRALQGPVYCFSASLEHHDGHLTSMEGCTPDSELCARAFQTALTYGRFVGYVRVRGLTPCRFEDR